MTYRQTLDMHQIRLEECIRDFTDRVARASSEAEVLALRREQNATLQDLLAFQARHMAAMAGEKVEPVAYKAEGILLPTFGVG